MRSNNLKSGNSQISSNETLSQTLACLTDLGSAALFTSQRLEAEPSADVHHQSSVLRMYSDEFLQLAESLRLHLVRSKGSDDWTSNSLPCARGTDGFDLDEELDARSTLTALSFYCGEKKRILEKAMHHGLAGTKVIQRALMLTASMKNWSLVAESHSKAS